MSSSFISLSALFLQNLDCLDSFVQVLRVPAGYFIDVGGGESPSERGNFLNSFDTIEKKQSRLSLI